MTHIERPPSPPSYLDSPPAFPTLTSIADNDGELPNYSRNAAADERIMLLEPLAARPSSSVQPIDYVFTSERIELNMGRKRFPIKVPCYGQGGIVEGKVTIKDFKAAAKVSVTLEGACNTNVVERGMNVYSNTKKLLTMTEVLWTRSEGSTCPDEPQVFSFSFRLPTNVHPPLAHSYATVHPGLNADVTYHVKVDLFRKGLRRHERLRTMILYLPRSTPPETPQRTSGSYTEPPASVEWETVPILPRWFQAKAEQSSQDLSNDAVDLILPLPKVYASAAPIPFQLTFPGTSPLLPYVTTSLSVQLIKSTVIRAGGFISLREGIIATGDIWRVEDESYPTPPPSPGSDDKSSTRGSILVRRAFHGTLKSFREGGETSWNLPEQLEIRYSIRVHLRAPKSEKNLPEYFIDHPVQMCTHNRIPNATDTQDPVIGLIAVAGSQGTPTSRSIVTGGVWV